MALLTSCRADAICLVKLKFLLTLRLFDAQVATKFDFLRYNLVGELVEALEKFKGNLARNLLQILLKCLNSHLEANQVQHRHNIRLPRSNVTRWKFTLIVKNLIYRRQRSHC